MRKAERQKNLLDMRYNKILNYMNIFFVVFGTGLITIWIALNIEDKQMELLFKLTSTIVVIISAFVIWLVTESRLREIKEEIEKLK